jgi:Bacterial type II/III secretion system short domain
MKRFTRLSILMMALLFVSALLTSESAFADAADVGKTLTAKTFVFKHKQADKAANVIKTILSAEGSMSIQPSTNALVVTDLPENMKKIAAALATFDAPVQSLQLSIRLVSAGRGAQNKVDPALADVASKLALLRYNVLESLGTAQANGKEGEPGVVSIQGYRADFHFGEYDPASDSVQVADFKLFRLEGDQLAPLLKTTLNLRIGQTVIIGATRDAQSQRALMIVVTAQR